MISRIISFLLIASGAMLMIFTAIRYNTHVRKVLSEPNGYRFFMRTVMNFSRFLLFFFIAGYTIGAIAAITGDGGGIYLLIGAVFFFGSVFAGSIVQTQILTAMDLHKKNTELQESKLTIENNNEGFRTEINIRLEEIITQDDLLRSINTAASLLLATNTSNFEEIIGASMEMIAANIEADRICIWRELPQSDTLCYEKILGWCNEIAASKSANKDAIPGIMQDRSQIKSVPEWEINFTRMKSVKGIAAGFSEKERERLDPFGILSIVAIPVFLYDKLWGIVSFDNCHSQREFSEDEERILQSGSLLFATAVTRNNSEKNLQKRFKQQAIMSRISQSFIAKESMAARINSALRETGELLRVARVIIAVEDKAENRGHSVYFWSMKEEFNLKPSEKGFMKIVNQNFPREMTESGSLITVCCDDTKIEAEYKPFCDAGIRAFMWAPIYIDGIYWGVLSIEECSKSRVWSESNKQLASMVSSAVSGAISRDLAERERADALAQALQASKAKTDFLSNMSHEMRTPMNAIIGMTTIGKSADNLERKDYAFDKIEGASTHMLGVINDILDMSKIEANKMELSMSEFNFEKMLQKVVNVINFRVEEKRQNFSVYVDRDIPGNFIGDDQRLAQVIANLLSNAVKFTPEDGAIRLNVRVTQSNENFYMLQVSVSDTGIGISKEQQKNLFTNFGQAETSTSRKFGGTGLGLAISKRIVELMGGRIWIESELEKGASFIFEVMLEKGSDEDLDSILKINANRDDLRFLVVDDEIEVCEYVKSIISQNKIACDFALNGEEALALAEKNNGYDLFFIDWMLPDMNGAELTKKIKEKVNKDAEVIICSAADWNNIEKEAAYVGVDTFLAKPLFASDIVERVNMCFGMKAIEEEVEEISLEGFKGRRILLAEDIEINREIVLALLEPTQLLIDCAENGKQAVKMFCESPESYDMIFMDIQMPEMDGYEATRRIRAFDSLNAKSIPIVAMTANVFREDIEKCLESGMDDHVSKPLDFDTVISKLRRYLMKSAESVFEKNKEKSQWKQGVKWSSEFETGNKMIDLQHKQLFKLASDLVEACIDGEKSKTLDKTLDFLVNYTVKHFQDEEQLQIDSGYPEYESHKKMHVDFTDTVGAFVAKYKEDGFSHELFDTVNSTVIRWLVQHITMADFKIAEHIKKVILKTNGEQENKNP